MASDYKNDGRLQLFVTNPQRFGPEEGVNAGPILPSAVSDPFYHNFFEDLMRQSRSDAKQMFEQKRLERGYCPITSAPRKAKTKGSPGAAPKWKSFGMGLKDRVRNGVENCLTEILKRLPERE
ncbi:MAG: hypothetical protein EOP11_03975 [Proteobacteria bacterium]|nr:MAG: hypothetical protein EOP11_03975 [Pseudomonadota bacterium]